MRTHNGLWARLASWFVGGRLVTPEQGSQTGPVSASGTLGDSPVTDERILQISTVWRCVSLISTLTACLPLDVFETDRTDNRTKVGLDNPLARLLRYSPNPYMTAQEFREAMTMQLCFYGNAYALIERNRATDVVSLVPLLSANMDVLLEGRQIIYKYQRDHEFARFRQHDIFHLKGLGFNGLVGLSPIAHAAKSGAVAVAMEEQQREFYANGCKSPKILSVGDHVLSAEQRDQVEANFREIAGGPVKKRLWILESNFAAHDIGVSPQDAETMAARKFQVSELARFFGVPPHLVGDVEKSTSWGTGDGKTTSEYPKDHRVNLPSATSGWSLRVRRITADSTSTKLINAFKVASYTEVIDSKLRYPHTALLYVELDAKQFNGSVPKVTCKPKGMIIRVPDNYDTATRTYSGTWTGNFKWAYSSNPAWIFYDLCLNKIYGMGNRVDASMIDKWSLYQIARYCDEPVSNGADGKEPRFTCNVYIQSQEEAYTVLKDLAATFRGITYWGNDQLYITADVPQERL